MTLFRNAVFVAALAGLVAGLAMSVMQGFFTVPLILQAETFENAGEAEPHEHDAAAPAGHSHDEEAEAWGPADGFERTAFTVAVDIVTAVGFALLLVVASEAMGGLAGWRAGLFWGLAGFAVFTLAPGLGLPPELPAMPAGDLAARQVWWIGTAVATAAGIACLVYGRNPAFAVIGLALIALPHAIGAPQPESHETPIPENLHHSFVVAVTVTNLVFWAVLGAAAGWARTRIAGRAATGAPALA